jgi:nicotinamidase-related amidase
LNKIDNGGFTNYQLYQGLQAWQVEDLIFGGVNASYCVWTTMNSATCHSYRVHTARDLIANAAAEREEEFERAIARISRKGRVYDSHQVLLKDLLPANI